LVRLETPAPEGNTVERLNTPAEPHDAPTAAGSADERPGVTSFVGREQELAALTAALRQARDERTCRLVTIIGPPGIGKSRLVREFTGTLREEATVVIGRCLSYGEGITYRPLAEIVRQLGPDPPAQVARLLKGDAQAETVTRVVLGAVGLAETAGGSDDTFWAFRRLFEALARERALVAVFEDLHWAEPKLLDLLESVTAFSGGAPIVLLGLARPELLERRPEWAVPGPDRIGLPLEPLSEPDARAMIGKLEPGLDAEVFDQIVERAEGNPLFLEQLVATQRESGEPKLPSTVQALLAARIGQLAPAERNLLERASVEGRTFHRGVVAKLLGKTDRAQIGAVLMALHRKQLIRPDLPEFPGDDAFRFAHVLIREAAYESLPKQRRAELHEQVAAWLDQKPESEDEIVGYHLEQAYRHREQLHRIDDHARQLAELAGERLAAAGERASAQDDARGAVNLLERATSLLPDSRPEKGSALVVLGKSLEQAGDYARREQVAEEAVRLARARDDRVLEWRARLVPMFFIRGPKRTRTWDEIEQELEQAIAELQPLDADDALYEAWIDLGRLRLNLGRYQEAETDFGNAVQHAERTGDERGVTFAGGLEGLALILGPTALAEVIGRMEGLLARADGRPSDEWAPLCLLAWAHGLVGRFEEARELAARGLMILEELGQWGRVAGFGLRTQAWIELLAGEPAAAEGLVRRSLELLTASGDEQSSPSVMCQIAQAVYEQGRYDEAEALALSGEKAAADDDQDTRAVSSSLRAVILARRGQLEEAEALARRALALVRHSDGLVEGGEFHLRLVEVLRTAGKDAEAVAGARTAVELFERKGAVVLAERARRLLEAEPDEEQPERARRAVTVVFADLIDSTTLGERLDPESLHSVLASYSERSAAALERHGGTVEKFIGDAVVGVFGLTELHEDDALRAVRAAVEVREAVAALSAEVARDSGVEISVRIGVNTGEVFVSAAGRREPFATGDALNVAARLEQAAGNGEILLGEQAYRLVESVVRAEPLDPLAVKGRAAKVRAWRLQGLDGDERLRPVSAAGVTSPSPTRPFVGRTKELHELRSTLEEANSGHGSLVLVTGEPGIGKTRLMQEFAGDASDRGWHVVVGRCWEEGGAPPYWPWIQVVQAAGGEFERLAEPPSDSRAAPAADPESVRFRLFDAVTRYLVEAARVRPLLIVVDDLHAADAPSLLLLSFLGGAIADSRLLVLGSYREGERRVHELATQFGELARLGRRVSLRGLSTDEVEAYVARVAGDASRPDAAKLHAITGGNPFFLGEVMRLLAAGGLVGEAAEAVRDPMLRVPEEVRSLIRRRVAGLSHEAISSLDVAAVIGREFDFRVLERTSRLRPARLLDVIAEAVETGIVLEGPATGHYTFVHELVRETLYEDLPPSRRLELHLMIGRVLEDLSRGDPDPPLSEIAHHLALAAPLGDVEEACDYLLRAGDRASGLLAYEEAAAHYRRALELLGTAEEPSAERRCELLLRLGDANWRAGDAGAARASYEEATEVARHLGAGELLARAALGYVTALGGFILFARFEAGATGVGLLQEALAALPETDSALRVQLLARLAAELCAAREPVERRLAVSEQAIEVARRLDDPEALVTALHSRYWALTTPELVQERLAHTEEMVRVARDTANIETEFLAHNARFHCFLELCDGRALDAEIEAMSQLAERTQQPFYRWHSTCLRTIRATLDGRFADAERLAGEALEIGRLRQSEYPAYVFEYAQQFAIAWARGLLAELWPRIESHSERYRWIPRWRDAFAAAELGDQNEARAEVERYAGRDFTDLSRDGLWIIHVCSLAEACVLVDDARRGEQLYDLLLPHADQNAVSYTQQPFGPVALRLGMLATLFGRWEDAERHFVTAIGRCELLGARAIRARVFCEHARMLLARGAAGDQSHAATLLDDAARLCEELGMPGLLERISALPRLVQEEAPAASFRREGDFWTIAYAGETFRLRDVKGLRYLAFLLGSPGKEIHALELARAAEGLPVRGTEADRAETDLRRSSQGEAEPVLDAQAREAYRCRLEELGDDLQEARDWGDPERIARIEVEIDALTDELARAAGLGGRDRELPSPAERARVSVTKAIRTAIKSIERHSPELGAHLTASIRTGRFCSYAPPGETPPHWTL
jgi:predicted ATPase/class 3 adenylate cyclase